MNIRKNKISWKVLVVVILASMAIGCGHDLEERTSATALAGKPFASPLAELSSTLSGVSLAKCDILYSEQLLLNEGKLSGDSLMSAVNKWEMTFSDAVRRNEIQAFREHVSENMWLAPEFADSAYTKRKTALFMGRCLFSYKFANYINLDGISALIYNVSYIFSIPRKALMGLRCSDGVVGYVNDLVTLVVGFVLAIIGLVVSTVLGIICHPIETLANILGVAYFGQGGFEAWKTYLLHTNLLASIWDLVWGAIICPLLQMFVFWL